MCLQNGVKYSKTFLCACLKEVLRANREKKCKSREGRRLLIATTILANCRGAEKMSLKEGNASVQGKGLGQLLNISIYFFRPVGINIVFELTWTWCTVGKRK